MPMLWVQLGEQRKYPIVIQPGSLDSLGAWTKKQVAGRTAFVITHPRLLKLYGTRVVRSLKQSHFTAHTHCIPEGETSKSLRHLESIIGSMLKKKLDRRTVVVALGGGVVGDLSGFVAATFMRGVDFIQVPTSLLAQVDSSVGGKVAVNHALGKNMIGAFYQPRLVLVDPEVLQTLSRRQFKSGLAEVIKSAAIADAGFFTYLEKNMDKILQKQMSTLTQTIRKTCAIKAGVVSQDEKENGIRAILNYGHTVGHALEAYHQYRTYLHGEAVAIGMVAAALLAQAAGVCDQSVALRQKQLISKAGLPTHGKNESVEKILQHMKVDKKAQEGKLNFVLTPKIGHARISNKLTPFSVRRAINCVVKGFAAEDF